MTDSEKRIIIDAFLNKDYKLIINSFSYERRKELFQSIEQLGEEIENELGTVISDKDGDDLIASFFTNDEAVRYLYETDDVDIKRNLMYCINDDDLKIELIKKDRTLTFSILKTLSSDEKLLEAIYNLDDRFRDACFYSFIKYFRSDENKLKYVEDAQINELNMLQALIESLNDIDLKYYAFNKYIKNNYPKYEKYELFQLINSIDDPKVKISKLNEFVDDYINNKFTIYYLRITINGNLESEIDILYLIFQLTTNLADEYKVDIFNILEKIESVKKIDFKHINNIINNISDFSELSSVSNYILSKYIEYYQDRINSNHLVLFVDKFGLDSLKYLTNKNIVSIINMNDDNFIKFLNIFSEKFTKLDNQLVNTVYNSCIQREYRIKNQEEYNIFSLIKDAIDEKNIKVLKELLIKIDIFKMFDGDIDTIINRIINSDNIQEYLDKINILSNSYIKRRREEYIESRKKDFYSEVKLEKRYEKNAAIKYYLSHMSYDDIESFLKLVDNIDINELDSDVRDLIVDKDKLIRILKFKINPKEEKYTGNKIDIKRFSKILNYMYENNMIELPDNLELNYEYYPKEVEYSIFLPVLIDININNLVNNIFSDNNVYQEFLNYLLRYKILGYGDTFNNIFKLSDVDYGNDTFIGLISYFDKIKERINTKNELMSLIDWSNCYSSLSSIYGIVLGIEDFGLIKSNPGPNSASLNRQERLDEALKKIVVMYKRSYVNVPTINQEVKLKSGKSIHVTLGDVTDTNNLTLGERTGACMRIGGAGSTLLDFCIENENGFHIIFRNSNNNFVSRVSGFRNGNTVFLNQLRFSKDDNYETEDVIDACLLVAKMLITKSKDSSYPIDNVVISATQAMLGVSKEEDLKIANPTDNLGYFYSDIKDKAVIIATRSKTSSFVPINLNQDGIPKYDTVRGKVSKITDKLEILQILNKTRIINNLLNGEEIDNIETLQEDYINNVSYVISGEDFYILVDNNDNIIEEFIMDKRINNNRTLNEINSVKEIYLQKEDVDTYENGYNI